MKSLIITSITLFAAWGAGEAVAACTAPTRITGVQFQRLFQCGTTTCTGNIGSTVCANRGTEQWQEQHRVGGQLWDYKKGPTDLVDPTKQVGTWSTASNLVTYTYTGGPSYIYSVHAAGAGFDFCASVGSGLPTVSGATFKPGPTNCP